MKTQPRASEESKYDEENIHISQAELEHEAAPRSCSPCAEHHGPAARLPEDTGQKVPSLPDACWSPARVRWASLCPVMISAGAAAIDLPNVPSPLRRGLEAPFNEG